MRPFTNRKGQTSITHLMNFSLPPRPAPSQYSNHRSARRNPTFGLGSGHHSVDKARYVHANYRFIVDPRLDYDAQRVDADAYIDWNSILQILASPISQSAECPICLNEPVAPRMARCGHIFCLPCLIRFMHSSTDETDPFPEKRPRRQKCPICWDSVSMTEVRPVRWFQGQEEAPPREGSDIVLRLVMRAAGTTLALPREAANNNLMKGEDVPWHFAADVMDFSRVMKGTGEYMAAQHDSEIEAIEQLERYDELMFEEDDQWTRRAVRSVTEAKERARAIGAPVRPPKSDDADRRPTDAAPTGVGASALSNSLAAMRSGNSSATSQSPTDYFFYQALQHYYLSPLDIRILKSAFGDFSSFPTTILPRVERVSTGHVVDDDLRRRAKYLSHLPHGCEVSFLECDWTDTVPANILDQFKVDIDKRRKRNADKDAREERERVRAEREEDEKRWGAARRKRPSDDLNKFRPDDFQPLNAGISLDDFGSPPAGVESTSPGWGNRGPNRAGFGSLASPSTSPSNSRTVWGTNAIAPQSPTLAALDPNPARDDGWLQGWERDLLDEDVAAELAGVSLDENPVAASSTAAGGKKGKKKGKKITLMSTNARRGA